MGGKALLQDRKILEDEIVALSLRQTLRPRETKPGRDLTHPQQQIMHLLRPRLVLLLSNAQTIA